MKANFLWVVSLVVINALVFGGFVPAFVSLADTSAVIFGGLLALGTLFADYLIVSSFVRSLK